MAEAWIKKLYIYEPYASVRKDKVMYIAET